MQAQPLSPSHSHAHLQAFESIQAVLTLTIHFPALAVEQDVNAQISKPWATQRELPNAHAKGCLILGRALAVPRGSAQSPQPTRTYTTNLEALLNPANHFPAPRRL